VRPPRNSHSQPSQGDKHPRKTASRTGLARALSKLGFCSRSNAVELIRAGRVKLHTAICRDPETPVWLGRDHIEVDGKPLRWADTLYIALNKPRGVITTASDEKGRQTVYDFLPENLCPKKRWLAPVGRLDKASEGLLLLTNDSEWAARITAPHSHLDKTYHVQIGAVANQELLQALTNGVPSDGELLCAKRAAIVRQGGRNTWLEIILDEGQNRQIRRMLEALQIEVLRLVRVAIGPLALGDLTKGATRALTKAEMARLANAGRPSPGKRGRCHSESVR
jgi:23S rRNA pseudouridine2605 synthase